MVLVLVYGSYALAVDDDYVDFLALGSSTFYGGAPTP
jgi:hypothetical protein